MTIFDAGRRRAVSDEAKQGYDNAVAAHYAPEKIGHTSRNGTPVLHWDRLPAIAAEHNIEIGIIAVPASSAQAVYDALAAANVSAILNFAPAQLRTRTGIKLKSVDLRINLESLSYWLKSAEDAL